MIYLYTISSIHLLSPSLSGSLRVVKSPRAEFFNLKPGQKVCPRCDTQMNVPSDSPMYQETTFEHGSEPSIELEESKDYFNSSFSLLDSPPINSNIYNTTSEQESEPSFELEDTKNYLNLSISLLDCSPVNSNIYKMREKVCYGKRKVLQVQDVVAKKVANVLNIAELSTIKDCTKCSDLDKLIYLMNEKITNSNSKQEKIQILTLVPESWSIEKTVNEFGVTEYSVKQARDLEKENGILARPDSILGKITLSQYIITVVELFYQDDEYSRMFPGKKDFVSVRINGDKVHKQKRLILININELYAIFKEKFPNFTVGKAKFFELRPKWCVPVGSKSSHSVCEGNTRMPSY